MPLATEIINDFEEVWVEPELVYYAAGEYRMKCVNSLGRVKVHSFLELNPHRRRKFMKERATTKLKYKYEFKVLVSPVKRLSFLIASKYELTPVPRNFDPCQA